MNDVLKCACQPLVDTLTARALIDNTALRRAMTCLTPDSCSTEFAPMAIDYSLF